MCISTGPTTSPTNVARVPAGGRPGLARSYGLVFVDRLLVTLVHLRTGLTYQALGVRPDTELGYLG